MNDRIAIIDIDNQDIGIKVLFPTADYYINRVQWTQKHPNMKHYNIDYRVDWSSLNDKNYDILFIQVTARHTVSGILKETMEAYRDSVLPILNSNQFKLVALFDNDDYDMDPSKYIDHKSVDLFFKRNYTKKKLYSPNVYPFSFIMCGYHSLIEMMDRYSVSEEHYFKEKESRIFWSGGTYIHDDKEYGVYRDRQTIYNSIRHTLYAPGSLPHDSYLHAIRSSKFSLDLLGCGDPNVKTVEILISGSLLIAQKKPLKYMFPEEFAEETEFETAREYFDKMTRLIQDKDLYDRCLKQQFDIVKRYLNLPWLRQYIVDKCTTYLK